MISNKIKALLAITLSTSIIGLSYVFIKTGVKSNLPLDLLSDRLTIAAILLLILRQLHCIRINKISNKQRKRIISLSLLYPIGFFSFQILGIRLIPASEASLIYTILPVVSLLISAIILKEKTTFSQKIGVALSVGGVLYIALQSSNNITPDYWGYFFIFCSLLFIAFYFVFLKKIVQEVSVITTTYYILLYGALITNIINLCIYIVSGNTLVPYFQRFSDLNYIYIILFLGILSTLMTSLFTNYSLRHLPVSLVGAFNNLSPIIGVFAGIFILHENLYSYYIYGGIIVLIGITMSTTINKK